MIAIPLVLRKVPRNPVYGFRTPATMSDDDIWYSANAHFGRGLIASTFLGVGITLPIYAFRPLPPDLFLPVSVLIVAAPSLVAVFATLRYISTLRAPP
ncbi:MAG: SdpI family protein [Pseudomonadota bacterium]